MNSSLTADEFIRYSRQIQLEAIGYSGQLKLKQAKVLCVGLGGLGSPVTQYLAAAGVGTLGLMDHDCVEASNLPRQILFRESDQKKSKLTAAAEFLRSLNSTIQIECHEGKFDSNSMIKNYDIIADCMDNMESRLKLHDQCYKAKIPYVFAAASQFEGYCTLFDGKSGPCLRCLFPSVGHASNCQSEGVLNTVPAILGLIQATEILKWITGSGSPFIQKMLRFDAWNMEFQEIQLGTGCSCPPELNPLPLYTQ